MSWPAGAKTEIGVGWFMVRESPDANHRAFRPHVGRFHRHTARAWSEPACGCSHNSKIATQPAIQYREPARGSARSRHRLSSYPGTGRPAACASRFDQHGVEEREFSRLCGLHADADFLCGPNGTDADCRGQACCGDVCRGRAMALPSFNDRGCAYSAWREGGTYSERDETFAACAHEIRSGRRNPHNVSRREFRLV
jgi:hypothetical protein